MTTAGASAPTFDGIPIEDGPYRYLLTRDWLGDGWGPAVFIMLNPSTATQEEDDATIARCIKRAQRLGTDGLRVVNLFAYRATQPSALFDAADPVGPWNDEAILHVARPARLVVAAWGTHGRLRGRAAEVTAKLTAAGVELMCLGVTKDGHPKHPLYVPASAQLVEYEP